MELSGRQPLIVAVSIVLIVLSTVSVVLRFFSRHMMGNKLWWDDWCAVVAMLLSYSLNIVQFVSVKCGLGKHTKDVPKDGPSCFLRALYAIEPFYGVCMPAIKMTMVLLYWRLFSSNRKICYALWVVAGLLIAWTIATVFTGLFQCNPIDKYWDVEKPGDCLDGYVYFVTIASTNLLTDIFILIIPLPVLWTLKRPLSERLALMGVFTLGIFVSAVSIIRIASLTSPRNPDPMWASVRGTIWTSVETSIGVVSVNLPVMSPLFRRYILGRTLRTTRTGWTSYASGSNRVKSSVVIRSSQPRHSTESTRPFEADEAANPPGNNIMVTTEVNVRRDSQPETELDDLAAADTQENHRHQPWREH
ncbi:hypothetical protein VTN96DRAFT_5976 [Rasamsonia emersonii]